MANNLPTGDPPLWPFQSPTGTASQGGGTVGGGGAASWVPEPDQTNPKDLMGVKKAPLFLVPNVARIYMSLVFKHGADKYGAFNWRNKKVRRSIYIEAIDRHLIALAAGEDKDPDSGLPHEAHIMACCAIMLDAKSVDCLIDDRYEKDKSAELLASLVDKNYYQAVGANPKAPARTLDEVNSAPSASPQEEAAG